METGPKWYITRGEQRIGPIDASQLKHMAMTEQLGPTEYVWKEGMAQWVQAQQVVGLFETPAVVANPVQAAPQVVAPVQNLQKPVAPVAPVVTTPVATTPATIAPAKTEPIRIPTPQPTIVPNVVTPRSPLPAISSKRDAILPLLGALIMLATFFVPWASAPEYAYGPMVTKFSWHMIGAAFSAGGELMIGVWLIVSWSAALIAIIMTPLSRGLPRGIILLILGILCTVFFAIVAGKAGLSDGPFKSGMSELETPLGIVSGILVFLTAIFTHLNRRSGPNTALRVLQMITAGALLIITIILFITAFAAANSIWSQYGSWRVKAPYGSWLRITLITSFTGTILASLMLLLNAIGGAGRSALSLLGLMILYLVTILCLFGDSIFTAGAQGEWATVLAGCWAILLMLGTAILLGSGLILTIDQARRA